MIEECEIEVDTRKDSCFHFFVVFSFVVFIGSFLIQLSFIRCNVVEVIGHDDIEIWTASDKAIGLGFEEAFLANVDRKGRDFTFGSS